MLRSFLYQHIIITIRQDVRWIQQQARRFTVVHARIRRAGEIVYHPERTTAQQYRVQLMAAIRMSSHDVQRTDTQGCYRGETYHDDTERSQACTFGLNLCPDRFCAGNRGHRGWMGGRMCWTFGWVCRHTVIMYSRIATNQSTNSW